MNDKQVWIWKEAVVDSFKILLQNVVTEDNWEIYQSG